MTLLEAIILSVVVIIEFSFATFFLLKWLVKNLKIEKPNVVVQNQTSPIQLIKDTKDNTDTKESNLLSPNPTIKKIPSLKKISSLNSKSLPKNTNYQYKR